MSSTFMAKYPLHLRRIDPFDLDDLHPARKPFHNANRRRRHSESSGEEPNARVVRFAIHWGSRQAQLVGVADLIRQRRRLRPRLHFYRDTRSCFPFVHVTSARRFATPAPDRASTTSNAIASSTQS